MRVAVDHDAVEFTEWVLSHRLTDPVRNNVPATLLLTRRDGTVATEPDGPWLRAPDAAGELVGVAVSTPPHGLLPTRPTPGPSSRPAASAEPTAGRTSQPPVGQAG